MRCAACAGSGWIFRSSPCAQTIPRPASHWFFPLRANSRKCSSAVGLCAPFSGMTQPRHGSSPLSAVAADAWGESMLSTDPSNATGENPSGFTRCATASSPSRHPTSCCRRPWSSTWSITGAQGDVTQGYAGDWTLEQLRGPAQRIADRIDALIAAGGGAVQGGWADTGSNESSPQPGQWRTLRLQSRLEAHTCADMYLSRGRTGRQSEEGAITLRSIAAAGTGTKPRSRSRSRSKCRCRSPVTARSHPRAPDPIPDTPREHSDSL